MSGSGSGTVRVRTVCRPREVQLDPVALGLQGPPGPGAVVKDVNGALVGVILDIAAPNLWGFVAVTRLVAGTWVRLDVSESGFPDETNVTPSRLYESADCSGTAWMPEAEIGRVGGRLILPAFNHGMVARYVTAPATTGTFRSIENFETQESCGSAPNVFTPPDRCCSPIGPSSYSNVSAVPTATVDLFALGLVPPFHVEGP